MKPVRWGYTCCFVIFPFWFGFPEKTCFEGEPDGKWMGVSGAQWGMSGEVLGSQGCGAQREGHHKRELMALGG